jgi:hypothetical protein
MRVELLWWEGCPSTDEAGELLRAALEAAGLDPAIVQRREIRDEAEAAAEGFPGSPTIRVDGADVQPTDEPTGLTCRIYRRRDGRVSPVPDPDDLRDAIRAALDESKEAAPR